MTLRAFIFTEKQPEKYARHIAFWTLYLAYTGFTLGLYNYKNLASPEKFIYATRDSLAFLPAQMFYTYMMIYVVIPKFFQQGKYLLFSIATAAMIYSYAVTSNILTNTLFQTFPFSFYKRDFLDLKGIFTQISMPIRGVNFAAGFAIMFKLLKGWYIKQKENEELSQAKMATELELLKAQLHPHFLFNTLNNIYAYSLKNSSKSPEMILKLSDILRYMLYECNSPKVALEEDLKIIRHYIELEQMRYGNELDLSLRISRNIDDYKIAPLLFLPFIENAFKHGASKMLEKPWMSIDISVENDWLTFRLANGKPNDKKNDLKKSGGIGINNTLRRLKIQYPDKHFIHITEEEELYGVMIKVKLEKTVARPRPGILKEKVHAV